MAKYNRYQRTAKYSNEFKATAVLLSHLDECTVKSVAEDLDIHPVQLSIWRKQYRDGEIVSDKRKKIVASDAAPETSSTSLAVALPPQTELTHSASTRAISQNRRRIRSEAYSEPEAEFAQAQTIPAASSVKGIHSQENHSNSESGQLSARLELSQKHYQRLLIISNATPLLATSKTLHGSDALLNADTNTREGLADTTLALSDIKAKMAVKKRTREPKAKNPTEQELEKESNYRTLREECDCQLPESLDDAVRMLVNGDIVASAKQP